MSVALYRACLVGIVAVGMGSGPASAESDVTVLDGAATFWRWRKAGRPVVVPAAAGAGKRTTLDGRTIDAVEAAKLDDPIPPDWRAADFDDAGWPRETIRGLEYHAYLLGSKDMQPGRTRGYLRTAVLCLRGRFAVSDPAGVRSLALSLHYRGGVVVYLNGTEVARGHMPDGPVELVTAAEAYDEQAYLDATGKLLGEPRRVAGEKESARRIALRDRSLGPAALPVKLLRKGTNVLAVEIHRADPHPAAAPWLRRYTRAAWGPLAITGLRLAAAGDGVTPNCRRPSGVQVFNQDRNDRLSPTDYGDPNEPLRPITLVAARNGVFSGKVVVSSGAPLVALTAKVGRLSQTDGGALPATAVAIQYSGPPAGEWNEALRTQAPERIDVTRRGGAAQSVWVRVTVPEDTKAGTYRGVLGIFLGGERIADVPVHVEVVGWRVPSPEAFRTFVGVYLSPTAVALRYGVAEWSERHWALLERSFRLLGGLGNRIVHLPLVDRTKLGNDAGMLTWVRRPDGGFENDFRVIERYLKRVAETMPPPKFVVAHVWHAGGWSAAGAKQKNTVQVLDPATGRRESMQVPVFGTAESKAFWTPVLEGFRKRLADAGMADALCVGSLCEPYPEKPVAAMFRDILGEVGWCRMTHAGHGSIRNQRPAIPGGGHVALHVFTYLPGLPDPAKPLPAVHNDVWPRVAYFRRAQGTALSLIGHRMIPIHSRLLGLPGFAHVCLDFWRCPKVSKHRGGLLYGYWPRASNYPGDPEPAYLAWPGADGAEPMTGYEALREGLQEAEAMIAISAALARGAESLPAELAARCRRVLRDVLLYCRTRNVQQYQRMFYHMDHHGWQELTRRLFTCAAEAAAPVEDR